MPLADTARLIASLELKDQFSRTADKAIGKVGQLERRFGSIGGIADKGLSNATRNLQRIGFIAGTAAVGGLIAATKAAVDFEDAFAGIRKTVDETDLTAAGMSFESLSEDIRAMAREIPVTAVELSRIGEAAGALGVKAADIDDFIRVVAELGVTTDLTSETAATALGQLGTILDLTGEDYREFSDTLVALGNDGASTESQIIDIAARFAAAGRAAGLTNDDILALSSAVASMGIDAESGGSALSRVFNNVVTNIGTSSEKADEFAEALGLSAAEFKDAWERDALGTFEDFLVHLETLDQFEAASLLKKVGITNVRDVNTVRLMSQNIDDVNAALETSRTSTGALGTEAGKKFEATAQQIKILKNNLIDVGITIGDAVIPKIVELSKKFVGFLNEPQSQQAIKDFADKIPGAIDELVKIAKDIPWGSIGDALKLGGEGAKAILQAFRSMPVWVQTAVITGWGLNKLTGGALGTLVGELGKGLIKGVLGMNAGVVHIKAGVVTGAGGPGVPGALPAAAAGALPAAAVAGIVTVGVVGGIVVKEMDNQITRDLANAMSTVDLTAIDPTQAQQLGPFFEHLGNGISLLGFDFGQQTASLGDKLQQIANNTAGGIAGGTGGAGLGALTPGDLDAQLSQLLKPGDLDAQFLNLGDRTVGAIDGVKSRLDQNNNGTVTMREAFSSGLGLTVAELRTLRQQTGQSDQLLADKLGISVEQLRSIRVDAATTVARLGSINNKEWSPTINTTVHSTFTVSARAVAQATETYHVNARARPV